jgi:hypothetical protein
MLSLCNSLPALVFALLTLQPALAINGPNGNSINIPGTPASAVGMFCPLLLVYASTAPTNFEN